MILAFKIWLGILAGLLAINILIASLVAQPNKTPLKKRAIQLPPPAVQKKAA